MYNISIVLIAKDEENYLEEFICYYKLIGVNHFYIYDNESRIPITTVLKNYSDCCDIINFPGTARQYDAYHHFLENFGNTTKWAIPIDTDEFIVLKKHQTLSEFLKEYNYADAIGINWIYFGDNYYDFKPDGLVIENYTHCQDGQNEHIKTIVKTKSWLNCSNVHFLTLKSGSKYIDCKGNPITSPFNKNHTTDIIQMNHYFSKSKEECFKKYKRGRADIAEKFELTDDIFNSWRGSLNQKEDIFLKEKFVEPVKDLLKQKSSNG